MLYNWCMTSLPHVLHLFLDQCGTGITTSFSIVLLHCCLLYVHVVKMQYYWKYPSLSGHVKTITWRLNATSGRGNAGYICTLHGDVCALVWSIDDIYINRVGIYKEIVKILVVPSITLQEICVGQRHHT